MIAIGAGNVTITAYDGSQRQVDNNYTDANNKGIPTTRRELMLVLMLKYHHQQAAGSIWQPLTAAKATRRIKRWTSI